MRTAEQVQAGFLIWEWVRPLLNSVYNHSPTSFFPVHKNRKACPGWISYLRMGASYNKFSITTPNSFFSCKKNTGKLLQAGFLIWECVRPTLSYKVMFCRVCGFRVRVWESYRTSRSFGYGYGSLTELTEVPGIVVRTHRTCRSSGQV